MKTAETKLNREIVSEAEWLVARKDLLTRENNFLDLVPKGRDENPDSTMDRVRRHDQYST
jgi:predicted dithiol-disulfide oxidoreductase (DUF899 family)